jgi:hypothetical protein
MALESPEIRKKNKIKHKEIRKKTKRDKNEKQHHGPCEAHADLQ